MTGYLMASPSIEPVSVDECRRYLGQTDDGDLYLGTVIFLARTEVETKIGRALINQRWQKVLNRWPPDGDVLLHSAPVDEVRVRVHALGFDGPRPFVPAGVDGEAGIVRFDPQGYRPALRAFHAIEIDYVTGFGWRPEDVPEELRHAILWRVKVHASGAWRDDDVPEYPPAIEQAIQKHIRRRN